MGNSAQKQVTRDTYKGKSDNLEQELYRLQTEYKDNFVPLYQRKWIKTQSFDEKSSVDEKSSIEFSILQFNILADGLSGAYNTGMKQFDKAPQESLYFKYRGFRILEEIANTLPDIITMEEVDTFNFLVYYLEPMGYSGYHQTKANSPCINIGKQNNINLPPDGVAIFYKNQKFKVVEENIYKYKKPVVAMLIHFRFIEYDEEFLVGVTHLKAAKDCRGESIRLKQLGILLPTWLQIKQKSNNIDLFIGCDLNSPNVNTCGFPPMAYHSVVNPKVFMDKYVNGNGNNNKHKDNNIAVPKNYESGYGLNMSSAYFIGLGNEPQFTTYKSRKTITCHTIDYIFYERDNWDVIKLLSIPKDDEVKNRKTYIPAWDYPSDHFAIGAMFALKRSSCAKSFL